MNGRLRSATGLSSTARKASSKALTGEKRYGVFKAKFAQINHYRRLAEQLDITPNELEKFGVRTKKDGTRRTAFNVMSYDGVSRETIIRIFPELNDIPADVYEQIEIEARYAGYIKRQPLP